jgi:hypothetical protein
MGDKHELWGDEEAYGMDCRPPPHEPSDYALSLMPPNVRETYDAAHRRRALSGRDDVTST